MSVKDADGNEIAVCLTFRNGGEYVDARRWREQRLDFSNPIEPRRKALCLEVHDRHGNDVCRVHLERTTLRAFLREALALIDAEDL